MNLKALLGSKAANQFLEAVLNSAEVLIAVLDPQFDFILVNRAYANADGKEPEYFPGKNHFALYPNVDNEAIFRRVLASGVPYHTTAKPFEYADHPERGVSHWDWSLVPTHSPSGLVTGLVLTLIDVTDRVHAIEAAQERERLLQTVLESLPVGVWLTDAQGKIVMGNPAGKAVWGGARYVDTEQYGEYQGWWRETGRRIEAHEWALARAVQKGETTLDEVIDIQGFDGVRRTILNSAVPIRGPHGEIRGAIVVNQDISEQTRTQERLEHLAHHDALTDLPNRTLFLDRLGQALSRASRRHQHVAVLFLDLDRFKFMNDTFGHHAGDLLLKEIARRLVLCLRKDDTVARLGGDEFAILYEEIISVSGISPLAEKVLAAVCAPVAINGEEFVVTTSIGISLYPGDGDDGATLLKNADAAMYRAKDQGRNNIQFYSADLGTRALERLTLERNLRRAIERGEFVLHFQPQLALKTRRLTGFEALVRWQPPDRELVSPTEFIPLAEETGLILAIGEWVLRQAADTLRAWKNEGLGVVPVTVNLSARQFADPRLAQRIAAALHDAALPGTLLELEITEGAMMHSPQAAIATLNELADLGIRLAIDDFGTGYSSLSYLKRLPIDTLKIDRSFIQDLTTDADDASIVSAVIAMAHRLKLHVIGEGVETPEQLALLEEYGCDGVQGYLFSRPVPADSAKALLARA